MRAPSSRPGLSLLLAHGKDEMKGIFVSLNRVLLRRPQNWGQGLVEFALVLPILLLVIFLIIEGALLLQAYLAVQHAAREAACG